VRLDIPKRDNRRSGGQTRRLIVPSRCRLFRSSRPRERALQRILRNAGYHERGSWAASPGPRSASPMATLTAPSLAYENRCDCRDSFRGGAHPAPDLREHRHGYSADDRDRSHPRPNSSLSCRVSSMRRAQSSPPQSGVGHLRRRGPCPTCLHPRTLGARDAGGRLEVGGWRLGHGATLYRLQAADRTLGDCQWISSGGREPSLDSPLLLEDLAGGDRDPRTATDCQGTPGPRRIVRPRAAWFCQRDHRGPTPQPVALRPGASGLVFGVPTARLSRRNRLRGDGRRAATSGLRASHLPPGVVDRVDGSTEDAVVSSRPALIDSTNRLVARSRQLLVASSDQIACSRRLLYRWHGISGGSADHILDTAASNLYDRVRARLHQHTLPPAPKLVLAGRATVRRVCIICRRAIRQGMMQHEFVAADGQRDWTRTLCLRVWIDVTLELRSRKLSPGGGDSSTEL